MADSTISRWPLAAVVGAIALDSADPIGHGDAVKQRLYAEPARGISAGFLF